MRRTRPHVLVTIYSTEEWLKPTRGTDHSTGLDMRAAEEVWIGPGQTARIPTGISIHVAAPCAVDTLDMVVRGRSGLACKGFFLHVGTIDLDYRGPMDVIMFNSTSGNFHAKQGDRVGQLIIPPVAHAVAGPEYHGADCYEARVYPVVFDFRVGVAPVDTARGAGGYGSTGR